MNTEQYLRPEVIRQVARLDLRAKFIVEGFLSGLHASPFHGFSVEFSEHRKYTPGDDVKDLDWTVYAKTEKYYLKKFQAETNVTGYLVMDLSASMGYTYRQELTKFDYAICLAAAKWRQAASQSLSSFTSSAASSGRRSVNSCRTPISRCISGRWFASCSCVSTQAAQLFKSSRRPSASVW